MNSSGRLGLLLERTSSKTFQEGKSPKNAIGTTQSMNFPKVQFNRANTQKFLKTPSVKSKDFIQLMKEERVNRAYNSISNCEDRDQILSSLKIVNDVSERIELIDLILKRKEEINQMKERLALYKLAPVLTILIRKYRKKKEKELIYAKKTQTMIMTKSNLVSTESIVNEVKKLQQKFTTSLAMQWLSEKRSTKKSGSPVGSRQKLLYAKDSKLKYNPQKVSQQSKELIEQGKTKFSQRFDHQKNLRRLLVGVKPKVETNLQREEQKAEQIGESAPLLQTQGSNLIEMRRKKKTIPFKMIQERNVTGSDSNAVSNKEIDLNCIVDQQQ